MKRDKRILRLLSIAGSDNTSGAGIQADIKTCHALKTYCLSCITSITSQNSKKFYKIFELPNNLIKSQIKTIAEDHTIDCIKIGLIKSVSQARIICKTLKQLDYQVPIVVDPIYKSSTDKKFSNLDNYIEIYRIFSKIKPVFTPNLNEAKSLLKISYNKKIDINDLVNFFFKIYKTGIVITDAGKNRKYCEDFFFNEQKEVNKFVTLRIKTRNTHGSGCTFSSALAIFLAKGFIIDDSVRLAKNFTRDCILGAPSFGLRYGPLGYWL